MNKMEPIGKDEKKNVLYNILNSGNIKLELQSSENALTEDYNSTKCDSTVNTESVQFYNIKLEPQYIDSVPTRLEKDALSNCSDIKVEGTEIKAEFVDKILFVSPEGDFGQSEVKKGPIDINDGSLHCVEGDPLNASELNRFVEGKVMLR